MAEESDDDATVRSVRRAVAILRAFKATDRSLPLSEIAIRARLDKGTARRLLRTLIAERLIVQDEAGSSYALGVGVLELAAGVTPCDDLRQLAQPALVMIAQATGATTFLGIVHDDAALCVARVDSEHPIQIRAWSVGGRVALNCGAGPRVLMAHLPLEQQERLLASGMEALTPMTPVTPAVLRPNLASVRARGWELGIDDVVEGIVSLGVAVRDGGGRVVAAISISGLTAHMLDSGRPRHLDALQAGVRMLESRLAAGNFA